MAKQTVCLDFDGVIHSYTSGWQGAEVIPDPVVPGALSAIREYIEADLRVAIFSSRSRHEGGMAAMKRYIRDALAAHYDDDRSFGAYLYLQLDFPTEKPPAMLYIDDRGFMFEGEFPPASFIKSFKPWNKEPPL